MSIKEITYITDLKAYQQDWDAILERSKNNNPFIEFLWIEKWWEVMGHEYDMYVLCAMKGNQPVAFLPLMKKKGTVIDKIMMIGYGQSNYMDIVAEEHIKQDTLAEVMDYVAAQNPNTLCLLSGFLDSYSSAGILQKYAESMPIKWYSHRTIAPYVNFLSADIYPFVKKRLKNHGVNRKENHLKREGTVSFHSITEEHIEEMFRLHRKRWEMKWDTSRFTEEPVKTFFREIALMEGDSLKPLVYGLFFEDTLIAFIYGLYCRDRFLFYLLGHDDDFGIYSPGKMILNHSILYALDSNATIYDLSIGEEHYKHEWKTGEESVHHFLFMSGKSRYSSLLFFLYRMKERLVMLLKKNHSIVLFRRNTLGKWKKYIRSRTLLLQKSTAMLLSSIRRLFYVDVHFVYKKHLTLLAETPFFLKSLSLKTVTTERKHQPEIKEIINRLYKGEKGYLSKGDNPLSDIIWINEKELILQGKEIMLKLAPHSVAIHGTFPESIIGSLEKQIMVDIPGTEVLFIVRNKKSRRLEEDGYCLKKAYRTVTIFGYTFIGGKRRSAK